MTVSDMELRMAEDLAVEYRPRTCRMRRKEGVLCMEICG